MGSLVGSGASTLRSYNGESRTCNILNSKKAILGNRRHLISFGGRTTTTSCQFRFSSPFYKYFWFYKARPTASPDSFFLFVLHDRFITPTILLHFIVFTSFLSALWDWVFVLRFFFDLFQAEWRNMGPFLHFLNFFLLEHCIFFVIFIVI